MVEKPYAFILAAATLIFTATPIGCTAGSSSQVESPASNTQPASNLQTTSESPSQTSPKHESRPVIACFGDSLTAGLGVDSGQTYPDFLQHDLDDRGYRYRVINQGISGNTTKDGVERLGSIVKLHPAIVIVEFGGNDGLRGLPIADSRANLDKIVATLKNTGAKVVLAGITLPPNYGPDYIRQFNQTYVLLAEKYRIPTLPFLLQNVYGLPGMMQPDNTHATGKGNAIVAENIFTLIHPMLKQSHH